MSVPLSLRAFARRMQPARNSCRPLAWLGFPARKRTFFLADAVKAVSRLRVRNRMMDLVMDLMMVWSVVWFIRPILVIITS